jgi:hypothetical protein
MMEWFVDVFLNTLVFVALFLGVIWLVSNLGDSWMYPAVAGAVFTWLWWRGGK